MQTNLRWLIMRQHGILYASHTYKLLWNNTFMFSIKTCFLLFCFLSLLHNSMGTAALVCHVWLSLINNVWRANGMIESWCFFSFFPSPLWSVIFNVENVFFFLLKCEVQCNFFLQNDAAHCGLWMVLKSSFIFCLFRLCSQYTVNCNLVKLLPTVAFHLGGQEYSLTEEDYILWVRTFFVSL